MENSEPLVKKKISNKFTPPPYLRRGEQTFVANLSQVNVWMRQVLHENQAVCKEHQI